MKLVVHVMEARNLLPMDSNGLSDPFVKLQLGRQAARKTKVVYMSLNPTWDEEFVFEVGDIREELKIYVYDKDMIGADFLGKLAVPLSDILAADSFTVGSRWYPLQAKVKKDDKKDRGEICLAMSLTQKILAGSPEVSRSLSDGIAVTERSLDQLKREFSTVSQVTDLSSMGDQLNAYLDDSENLKRTNSLENLVQLQSSAGDMSDEPQSANRPDELSLASRISQLFTTKNGNGNAAASRSEKNDAPGDGTEASLPEIPENIAANLSPDISFDALLKTLESRHQGAEMPANLQCGVLVDKCYITAPRELNILLFSPSSDFRQLLANQQHVTDLHAEPWRLENAGVSLKRIISYRTAPTKLVKAVTATEEQVYLKATEEEYAVLSTVSTPDAPYGYTFKIEILFRIAPGQDLASGERTSHLEVSWKMNFVQSTMMKSLIENGAKQGLRDSYAEFADVLAQQVKTVDSESTKSIKDQMLASLETKHQSDWKLAHIYIVNLTVISTVLVAIYILIHMWLSEKNTVQGLEFSGVDLPDTVSEVIVTTILVLLGQRAWDKVQHYLRARHQKGDHGIKAQGEGWLLTIALIEGSNLAAVDATGSSDPYVTFTCNGRKRSSSIKLQTLVPKWNEIFEFDAMDEPPSLMHIDVFDYDGPFDEVTSLGHAEVNFVKSNLAELADIWIPLQGNLAQSHRSQLHLKIFLTNTKGSEVVQQYLNKMEKEVGDRIVVRPPEDNAAFQKLFSLSEEDFLITHFTCSLKRKMPTRGRLFLSPRIIGFHSNFFGHHTKFFLLWDDVEDVQTDSPQSTGSSSIQVTLRRGKGMEAKAGAKSIDDGKLRFIFQSFGSFGVAKRTVTALWRARALSGEQKVLIAADESSRRRTEEGGVFVGTEDGKSFQMSEIFSSVISLELKSLMEIFGGGSIERRVMERVGCNNYSVTEWDLVKPDVHQREVHYKFSRKVSPVGGEASSTQQKSTMPGKKGCTIDEVMELQGVLLGDHFCIHIKYQMEELSPKQSDCKVTVLLGVEWLKSTRHQKRVTKNIVSNSSSRLRDMFYEIQKEFK